MSRKPGAPLSQIAMRLSEMRNQKQNKNLTKAVNARCVPQKEHHEGPLPYEYRMFSQFGSVCYGGQILSLKNSNSCISIGKEIVLIRNIIRLEEGKIRILYEPYQNISNFFDSILPSSHLGVKKVSALSGSIKCAALKEVRHKYFRLPYKDGFVVSPLSHLMSVSL